MLDFIVLNLFVIFPPFFLFLHILLSFLSI